MTRSRNSEADGSPNGAFSRRRYDSYRTRRYSNDRNSPTKPRSQENGGYKSDTNTFRRSPGFQSNGRQYGNKQIPPRFVTAKNMGFGNERRDEKFGKGYRRYTSGWESAGIAEQSYVNTDVANNIVSYNLRLRFCNQRMAKF